MVGELHPDQREAESERNGVGEDHGPIAEDQAVNEPEQESADEGQQPGPAQISAAASAVGAKHLGKERGSSEKSGRVADEWEVHNKVVL